MRGNLFGLTLAEIVVSLALTAMATLLLVGVMLGGLRLLHQSQEHAEAVALGRELIENIKARDYEHPFSNGVWDGRTGTAVTDGFPPLPYPGRSGLHDYRLRVTTENLDVFQTRVLVEVFWDVKGRLEFETLVPR